jgi:hypothetical protein
VGVDGDGARRRAREAVAMFVEYEHESGVVSQMHVDFVVPTVEEAFALIADGAINRLDLLEQAGLTTAEAEAELKRIEAS